MYEKLITQLKGTYVCVCCKYGDECTSTRPYCQLNRDAADAIEQQGKENAELRAELERLKKSLSGRYRFLENERLRNELEAVKRENERLHKENFWLNRMEALSDV